MTEIFNFKREISTIGPSEVFSIHGFPIANSTLYLVLFIFCLICLCFYIYKRVNIIPSKIQAFIEIVYESILSQINTITASEYHTKRIFPLIATVFVFVGISNYSGLIPGLSSITWKGVSVFRIATGDFNTTFGLTFGSLIVLHFTTIKDIGILGYLNKFIPVSKLKEDMGNGILSPIYIFVTILMALLDIIGELAKTLSPALRLFGNMYAGDVLTTVLIGICAFIVPSFWVAFGLLGALIQTIVFGSLITLFYMQAAGPEPGHGS